ncbi:hypothetical protein, partial [Staphylococcus aureus]
KQKKYHFLMIRRPPRSTRKESSAASDVYKRQQYIPYPLEEVAIDFEVQGLSLIHISEPTRH